MKSITLEEVLTLPVAERIRIVEVIWDSIADSLEGIVLTDDVKAELDHRLAALELDPSAGSSWAAVRARVWPSR